MFCNFVNTRFSRHERGASMTPTGLAIGSIKARDEISEVVFFFFLLLLLLLLLLLKTKTLGRGSWTHLSLFTLKADACQDGSSLRISTFQDDWSFTRKAAKLSNYRLYFIIMFVPLHVMAFICLESHRRSDCRYTMYIPGVVSLMVRVVGSGS